MSAWTVWSCHSLNYSQNYQSKSHFPKSHLNLISAVFGLKGNPYTTKISHPKHQHCRRNVRCASRSRIHFASGIYKSARNLFLLCATLSTESKDGLHGAGSGQRRSSGGSKEVLRLQDGIWYGGPPSGHGSGHSPDERPHYHPNHAGQLTVELWVTCGRNSALCLSLRSNACLLSDPPPPTPVRVSWQGLCCYLEESFGNLKERGVVIGYDARAHPPSGGSSKRFAALAAAVFISRGVPVHLFSDITPTPFVVKTSAIPPISLNHCVFEVEKTLAKNPHLQLCSSCSVDFLNV